MSYATEEIANTLKAARERKGLSQRELSAKSGVPQGHISKIENGTVDLRVSSLVALARFLDLELALVPRKTVTAVKAIIRSSGSSVGETVKTSREALKELRRLQDSLTIRLQDNPAIKELAQLQRQARELQRFTLGFRELEAIREADKAVKAFSDSVGGYKALQKALADMQKARNLLAHHAVDMQHIEYPRPAYSLDGDDDG